MSTGRFHVGPNSMEGKWMAERLGDALVWVQKLEGPSSKVVAVEVQAAAYQAWFRLPNLDQIGPAVYAEVPHWSASCPSPEVGEMTKVKARIRWLAKEEGGRSQVPTGPRFASVARFEEQTDWPQSSWTLVVQFVTQPDAQRCLDAEVWFLVEEAPEELLHVGSRFALYENRPVATGEVVG